MIAIIVPILLYIIFGCLVGRFAYKRKYAKIYPDALKRWSFVNSIEAREKAHSHAHEMALFNSSMTAPFWIFVIPAFALIFFFKWMITANVTDIQNSVETLDERRERLETLRKAEAIVNSWEPQVIETHHIEQAEHNLNKRAGYRELMYLLQLRITSALMCTIGLAILICMMINQRYDLLGSCLVFFLFGTGFMLAHLVIEYLERPK